jgi:hypothetical protein
MQAQLAYLDSQIAMATLTVSIDEPGPIVRPSSDGWGFVDSVTEGIQGAAALLRTGVTLVLTLSPVLVVGGIVWWLLAWRARRRRLRGDPRGAQPGTAATPPPASATQQPGNRTYPPE